MNGLLLAIPTMSVTALHDLFHGGNDTLPTLTVLTVIATIIVLMLGASKRNAGKLRKALKLQHEASIQQKQLLVKEMHHRVKNNLQFINTILDLQLQDAIDDCARHVLAESTARINTISLIHHQLYSSNMSGVDCALFAAELQQQVGSAYSRYKKITFFNHVSALQFDVDTMVPVGLIINELLTNSYKHAFVHEQGFITLGINKVGDGYVMRYKDSGPGLPPGFDLDNQHSLGMTIIKNLARQVGGALNYLKETKTFVITFRDSEYMNSAT